MQEAEKTIAPILKQDAKEEHEELDKDLIKKLKGMNPRDAHMAEQVLAYVWGKNQALAHVWVKNQAPQYVASRPAFENLGKKNQFWKGCTFLKRNSGKVLLFRCPFLARF